MTLMRILYYKRAQPITISVKKNAAHADSLLQEGAAHYN
ncbi:MAG: hypothetical protein CEN89_589 [Candidatus Berkelbacteria bacterium Licking1014_7]|uniref:Uncharacterized protein n=1 Tax=Candidatus Berkelbacteria bacterium Licking1014_7 TaxID=2017147 RepID=A0A554LI97_9BACT|nr:MAG: hypothetical protein CEN89_589 [Candidatus Berkelbacteria bacterium Licking1014_7]